MTDKTYIVANEEQEREVLETFEREGLKWKGFSEDPTQWLPTRDIGYIDVTFPYVLFGNDVVSWCRISELQDDYEIVFDGRKEEKMSDKYVVSQEFMKELEEWKQQGNTEAYFVGWYDISVLPDDVKRWWTYPEINNFETNNRLIAIIRWVNGEDVFEVEKPKKWAVRSKGTDNDGDYRYVSVFDSYFGITYAGSGKDKLENATHFDTKEEAEGWANAHQEVVEVEE
ncbi:hypothetical protein EFA59_02600 [Weissella hellenica]|nr:hypothetical protein EFA59_02600 [Weissella hellenica]